MVTLIPEAGLLMWLRLPHAPAWPVVVVKGSNQRWLVRALGTPHPVVAKAASSVVSARVLFDLGAHPLYGATQAAAGAGVVGAYREACAYIRARGGAQYAQLPGLAREADRHLRACSDAVERISASLGECEVALVDAVYDERACQDDEAESALAVEQAAAELSGAQEALEVARKLVADHQARHDAARASLQAAKECTATASRRLRDAEAVVQAQMEERKVGQERLTAARELRRAVEDREESEHSLESVVISGAAVKDRHNAQHGDGCKTIVSECSETGMHKVTPQRVTEHAPPSSPISPLARPVNKRSKSSKSVPWEALTGDVESDDDGKSEQCDGSVVVGDGDKADTTSQAHDEHERAENNARVSVNVSLRRCRKRRFAKMDYSGDGDATKHLNSGHTVDTCGEEKEVGDKHLGKTRWKRAQRMRFAGSNGDHRRWSSRARAPRNTDGFHVWSDSD